MSEIRSVDVNTLSAVEDIKKLIHQDYVGVRPTELCTCSENVLCENNFVRALSTLTTFVNGRMQVKMPWKEARPPKRSNYDLALKRIHSAEKSYKKRRSWWNKALLSKYRMKMLIAVNHNGTCHFKPCLLQKRALKSDW